MTRSVRGRRTGLLEAIARRLAAGLSLLVTGSELHVTGVIDRAAKQARRHRDLGTSAWVSSLRQRSGVW